jgi:hypothetical protein
MKGSWDFSTLKGGSLHYLIMKISWDFSKLKGRSFHYLIMKRSWDFTTIKAFNCCEVPTSFHHKVMEWPALKLRGAPTCILFYPVTWKIPYGIG